MTSEVRAERPLAVLRSNVADLEAILEHRKIAFQTLAAGGALGGDEAAGGNNSSSSNTTSNHVGGSRRSSSDGGAVTASHASPPYRGPTEEARALVQRNALLRAQLAKVQATMQQRASNPRVLDKRNEVVAVERQIRDVEAEMATLSLVKRRRDVGLRAIDKSERHERRVRQVQQQRTGELRAQLRGLTEQLREAKRADLDAHAQYTRLVDVVKLNVTVDELQQLEHEVSQQETALAELKTREQQVHDGYAQRRRRQRREREVLQKQVTQAHHECRQLEQTLAKLQKQLRWLTSPFTTTSTPPLSLTGANKAVDTADADAALRARAAVVTAARLPAL